ncbi:hypothetical protein MMC29_003320 [Sticta canariensis]|nr:hypothetical protein [Sticta canariensis]
MNGRAYLARFPNRLHRHFGNRASRCVERAAQDEAQALHRQALTSPYQIDDAGASCEGAHSHAWPSDIVPFELHGGGFRNIFRTLEEDFQQMRNRVFSHPAAQRRAGFAAADLQETEKQISLKLDVPGISKENIKVCEYISCGDAQFSLFAMLSFCAASDKRDDNNTLYRKFLTALGNSICLLDLSGRIFINVHLQAMYSGLHLMHLRDAFRLAFALHDFERSVYVQVQLGKDRKLTISGQRESAAQTETPGGMQRTERSFGKFQREFHLPESADTASIAAKAENGVLSIEIQKLAPEARNISEITVA